MKRFLSILFFAIGLVTYGQLPTIHPGTVTIGTVPEATATDSILTVNSAGLIGHIPKSELGGSSDLQAVLNAGKVAETDSLYIYTPLVENVLYLDDSPGWYESETEWTNRSLNLKDTKVLEDYRRYEYYLDDGESIYHTRNETDRNFLFDGGLTLTEDHSLVNIGTGDTLQSHNHRLTFFHDVISRSFLHTNTYLNYLFPDASGTLATREWVTANSGGVPTLSEVLEVDYNAGFWPIHMAGGDLTFSTYGNIPLGGLISQGYEYQLNLGTDNTVHRTIISPNYISLTNGNNVEARLRLNNATTGVNIELTMPGASGVLATEEWVNANGGGTPTIQEVLNVGNDVQDTNILINRDVVTFGTTSYQTILQGDQVVINNTTDDITTTLEPLALNFYNGLTLDSFGIYPAEGEIRNFTGSDQVTLRLTGDGVSPGVGTFVFPELAVNTDEETLATQQWVSGEITPITAKGMNFNTQKFFAVGNSYQGATTHNLIPSFFVGNNTFDVSDRQDLSIYEGSLYFRYVPFDAASTADINFSFAGNNHLMADASGNDILYYEIDYTMAFTVASDTYSIIATIKRFNADQSVSYSYVTIENQAYTNTGNINLGITSTNSDAFIEIRVYKADLKRLN